MEVYASSSALARRPWRRPPAESPRQVFDELLLSSLRRFLPVVGCIYAALTLAAHLFGPPDQAAWLTLLAAATAAISGCAWAGIRRGIIRPDHAHAVAVLALAAALGYELARGYLEAHTQFSSGVIVLLVVASYVLLRPRVLAAFLTVAASGSIAVASARGAIANPSEFTLTLLGILCIATAVHRMRRRGLEDVLGQRREDQARQIALAASEERYALAVQGANDGLWDWRLDSGEIYLSPRWKHVLGFEPAELPDAPATWLDRIHPKDRARVERALARHLGGESAHFESRHRLRTRNGRYRWVLARGLAVRDPHGNATRIAGSLTDIHRLKQVERKLRRDALHDRLTGLANRKLLRLRMRDAVEQLNATPPEAFGVVFLDVDRFKAVNDTHGHLAGDQLLRVFAERLGQIIRPADTVARLGGDEFVILLRAVATAHDVEQVSRRISAELAAPITVSAVEIPASACVGYVFADDPAVSADGWLRRADCAMYSAKSLGPASVAKYSSRDEGSSGVEALARAVGAGSSTVKMGVS